MNKLGFGFLRLPYNGEKVDDAQLMSMVDAYMDAGGKYFDTAYTYLKGESEAAIRRCVTERKRREDYILCDKLPGYKAKCKEDCHVFFEEQLKRCGVTWFDVYMLHWLNAKNTAIAEQCREFEFLRELKTEGKARRIGFSYHDSPELLDEILTRHPEVDCVLLQMNYLDWESASIQSRRCYETAVAHGVSVFCMEPVKGGTLAKLPRDVEEILAQADAAASPAEQAIRFVQSLPGVEYVLSGMSSLEQVRQNTKIPAQMSDRQKELLLQAAEKLRGAIAVPCTGCGYCLEHCPQSIQIPRIFALQNDLARTPAEDWKIAPIYARLKQDTTPPSACLKCHACEKACPQKLPISELLEKADAQMG